MNSLIVCLILTSAFIGMGCTSTQVRKDWDMRISSPEFQTEKTAFKDRLNGKEICWTTGIAEFMWKTEVPSKTCLYPSGRFLYNPEGPAQYPKLLKVMQATPQGFLIEGTGERCRNNYCSSYKSPSLIFIYKSNEQNIVDGTYLDEKADGLLYEYAGPYSYQTALGSKTVHAFKRVPREQTDGALAGLKVYNPYYELLAQLEMWSLLEKAIQPKEMKK